MTDNVEVTKSRNNLFHVTRELHINDAYISILLNISLIKYRDILVDQFNGNISLDNRIHDVYFNTEEDANKALDWVESIKLLNKLNIV